MAKQLLRTYVFTPGGAGAGTVILPGNYTSNQLLLITNTTSNVIIYSFANVGNTGTTATFTRAAHPLFPGQLGNSDGYTTITLSVATTAMNASDNLQIFVDMPYQLVKMAVAGTDAWERTRMSAPQSMIDADFEYGLQPTKWQQLSLLNNYPSIYEISGSDMAITIVTTDASVGAGGVGASLITVNTLAVHGLVAGQPVTVKGYLNTILGFSRAEGSFFVNTVPTPTSFTYYAKSKTGVNSGDVISAAYTIVRKGGLYTGSSIGVPTFTVSNASSPSTITVTFATFHGLVAGQTILTAITSTGSNHGFAQGPFFVETVVSLNTITYSARSAGTIDTGTAMNGAVYARPDAFYIHRPFDGGVMLGTGGPQYGLQAIRMSKKYIRYQSGKAINYNTGLLLAPSYDIRSLVASPALTYGVITGCAGSTTTITVGSTTGLVSGQSLVVTSGVGAFARGTTITGISAGTITVSAAPTVTLVNASVTYSATITVSTDDTDHGFQPGAYIQISGVTSSGYNGFYNVASITDERTFTVAATGVLGHTTALFGDPCQVSLIAWYGSTVRAGTFDEQNGQYWQYDGQTIGVGYRSSTFQLAGTLSVTPDSNTVTGTNTRFSTQVAAGDRIVIKGMTHKISNVVSDTLMYVTPDYRGVTSQSGVKAAKTIDFLHPQTTWNLDRCDGTNSVFNPSGFLFNPNKMQMVGIQWTWYGAGFIDWMLRGPEGNYITVHRVKHSNVNTEAYMRSGNMPVRYEVINEGPRTVLSAPCTSNDPVLSVTDTSLFPPAGILNQEGEIIQYTGKTSTSFTGCVRGTNYSVFASGITRTFQGTTGGAQPTGTGLYLLTQTATPNISHWGSAFITDGGFDQDRGYLFNYVGTNISVSSTIQTAFLLRLAPSVSNATVGDLGDRELLNRAQLLLSDISCAVDSGATGGIVIQGILNPSNYPTNPGNIQWTGLSTQAAGGQPSFSQIAPGGSVTWSTGATVIGTAITTQAFPTGSITARAAPFGANSIRSDVNYLFVTNADYASYQTSGLAVGDFLSGSNVPTSGNQIQFIGQSGSYYYIQISSRFTGNTAGDTTLTVTRRYNVTNTSVLFFSAAEWSATTATIGTQVYSTDVNYPAGTNVNGVTNPTYFGTNYYRVTFTQNLNNGVNVTPGTTQVTFSFGQPPYALPGETVFSFIATSGALSNLDLNQLKELTNTTIGGRGTYPNGPDVLAINIYKTAGAAVTANVILRWGEAQA